MNGGGGDGEERAKRFEKLQSILDKHSVTICRKDQLAVLEDYNFVVICDDSQSMTMSAQPKELMRLGEKTVTRWMELQDGVMLLLDMLGCLRPEGVDVHFFNGGKVPKVASSADERLQSIFQKGPKGKSPLTSTLRRVAMEAKSEIPFIIFIFTDGEPDGGAKNFTKTLGDVLSRKVSNCSFRVQIMACSNDDAEIAWLSDLDQQSELVDVTDDYYNEKRRILAMKGDSFSFTRSDWVVKAILGPVERSVDGVNETILEKLGVGVGFRGSTTLRESRRSPSGEQEESGAVQPEGNQSGQCSACTVS